MVSLIDITGMQFGRLAVVSLSEMRKKSKGGHRPYWLCKCACGNFVSICGSSLKSGGSSSCGCLQKEYVSIRSATHRMTATRPYRIWAGMLTRCTNKNSKDHNLYGDRGISVCDRWRSFDNFISDMGMPCDNESIERIDTNGNYEPSNCKWATSAEQSRNKRNNHVVEFNGESMIVADWAKIIGINESSLRGRLKKYPIDIALTTPKGELRNGIRK